MKLSKRNMAAFKYSLILSILVAGINCCSAFSPVASRTGTLLSTNVRRVEMNNLLALSASGIDESDIDAQELGDVGFVLLAGGTGSRMKANMPKQFMTLKGMPVLHHSLDLFLNRLPEFASKHGLR